MISDLRPMGGVGYPAGVAIVDDCARGCVLGSERKSKRPEEHMPPRLRRKLPSINISAGERSESRELRILQHSTCDMYSSSSCDGGTHVLSTLIRKVYPTYRIYNSCSESYACVCTSKYVMYSRRCDMYSNSSSIAAVMELRMYYCCQRCYVRYVVRTVSTAAAAVVLPFYAATRWVVGHRTTVYVLPEFL